MLGGNGFDALRSSASSHDTPRQPSFICRRTVTGMRRWTLLLVAAAAALSSCSWNGSATVMPGADIVERTHYHVRQSPQDDSNVGGFIAEWLRIRGYEVSVGLLEPTPTDADVLVVYEDRWTWDMVPYLLTLRIDFRDPQTNVLLATGQSYRTSLVRKTPEGMVNEVLGEIYRAPGATAAARR